MPFKNRYLCRREISQLNGVSSKSWSTYSSWVGIHCYIDITTILTCLSPYSPYPRPSSRVRFSGITHTHTERVSTGNILCVSSVEHHRSKDIYKSEGSNVSTLETIPWWAQCILEVPFLSEEILRAEEKCKTSAINVGIFSLRCTTSQWE